MSSEGNCGVDWLICLGRYNSHSDCWPKTLTTVFTEILKTQKNKQLLEWTNYENTSSQIPADKDKLLKCNPFYFTPMVFTIFQTIFFQLCIIPRNT